MILTYGYYNSDGLVRSLGLWARGDPMWKFWHTRELWEREAGVEEKVRNGTTYIRRYYEFPRNKSICVLSSREVLGVMKRSRVP